MKRHQILSWLAAIVFGVSGAGSILQGCAALQGEGRESAASLPPVQAPATRPFHMGFTLWPADLSAEGVRTAREFAETHGDIVAVTLLGGVPWPEAAAGKPFSRDVQQNLSYRPPAGKKLFLSITPLDKDRRRLAPYWGEKDNLPLPAPWDREALNGFRARRAFLNFALRCVEAMRPDYLAIAVEANVMLSREPVKWRQLKQLYRETYVGVKKKHPALPVFFTTDVLHYKRLMREAKGSAQEREVAELMKHSDLFAIHAYPYMSPEVPRPVPANFFDFATRFKKPVAVAESGMLSRPVALPSHGVRLNGSDLEQHQFTELLLKTAARDGYEFVINFATTDYDRLLARLRPQLAELASIWAYTGMQSGQKKPKPAFAVWDAYYRARLVRTW